MTTKEIAEVAGVNPRTVTRVAKQNKIGVITPGVETIFTERESVILMSELRKKGFVEPRQNVAEPRQNVAEPRQNVDLVTRSDLAAFGASIVSETIKQLLPLIQGNSVQPAKTQTIAAPVAALPPIDPRKELNMLAREAGYAMGDYREPYNQIYKHAYYRLGVNLRERAKNRGIDVLDYAAEAGYMPQLVAIAREIFK